jgi:nitrogen regulatory protein PII
MLNQKLNQLKQLKEGEKMPYALFIVLNEMEYLDDILAGFTSAGVSGATILDSQGMAKAILGGNNRHMPLFGSLKTLLGDSRPYSKTIFTVLNNESAADSVAEMVKGILCNTQCPGAGYMFSVPIGKIYSIQ